MPTMYEIYDNHAVEYDELVAKEDYRGNLKRTLNSLFDFDGKSIIELGSGTGRVTAMYIDRVNRALCYDRSRHMLEKAENNLSDYRDKITFGTCDNNSINLIGEKADFVLEGWSFGHTVSDFPDNAEAQIDQLVNSSFSLLNDKGSMIFIESMGTDAEVAAAPAPILGLFYDRLKNVHGFTEKIIETDYSFETVEEAARVLGFFFGSDACEEIKEAGNSIIKEYTGIWYKQK